MAEKNFDNLYKQLNPEQKEAVDTTEGPVMVIAGPGTGKTQILTLRIANILKKTDTTPDSIIALTFTEAGVQTMRKRLVQMMGSNGYRVGIFTFHGFCNDIIKRFPEYFPRIIGSNNITDIEKLTLLKNIIEKAKLKYLKPFGDPLYYLHPLRAKISDFKRENISPKDLEKIIKDEEKKFSKIEDLYHEKGAHKGKMKGEYQKLEKDILKHKELLNLYKDYKKALEKEKLYDYEDMIVETIKSLEENEDLLLRLQEEYQYVLADEHQDANNAQNRLLELMTSFHDSPNLFIVGDEKQAIFKFQGASLENFLYFKKRYPEAKEIVLVRNYRSNQEILDGAHSLISKTTDEVERIPLEAHAGHVPKKINKFSFALPNYQYQFLAKEIKEKIDGGEEAEEIAVLYRDNKDVEPILDAFVREGVPYVIESDQNVLQDDDIRKLVVLLRAVEDFGNDTLLSELLHIDFLNIEPFDIYKLISYASKNRMSIYDVLKSEEDLLNTGAEDLRKLSELYRKLASWRAVSFNKNLLDLLEIVTHESGLIGSIISREDSVEKMEKLSGFFEDIKRIIQNNPSYRLPDFISYLDLMIEHNVFVKKDKRNVNRGEVRLMTAHRSKGLEFDYIYITDVYDGHWGNRKRKESFKLTSKAGTDNDDERRLFYVALTRARREAAILYPREKTGGEEVLPSQFVEEIDDAHLEVIDTNIFEKEFSKNDINFVPKKDGKVSAKNKEYLNKLFLDQGLSVTALNNYLECPWQYFYNNLVRVPHVSNKHAMYGVAVHETLKEFFDAWSRHEDVGKGTLLLLLNNKLQKQAFSEKDFEEVKEKGEVAVGGFYDKYKNEWLRKLLNEFSIKGVHLNLGDKEIKIRGNLDKVEILNDQNEVNVVDYKTGKPKSRNVIEGNTKTSNGNYKRQLVFYKLLLDLFDSGKYKMVSGEIDFVEPDDKGNYRKEKFVISDEEKQELVNEISRVSDEILNLDFWDSNCSDKKCRFCELRKMM